MDAAEARKIGRDAVIQHAIRMLEENGLFDMSTFSLEIFDSVKVLICGNGVRVVMRTNPTYIPLDSCFCYGADMDLSELFSTFKIISNPEEASLFENVKFFNHTKDTRKAMKYVLGVIRKRWPDHVPDFMIYERADHYEVQNSTVNTDGGYKISKKGGDIYDEWHKHKVVEGDGTGKEGVEEL